jgi:hypothetical protein
MSQQGDSQETNYTQLEYPANTPRQPNTQANGSLSPVTPRQSGRPFSPQFTLGQGNYSSNFLSTSTPGVATNNTDEIARKVLETLSPLFNNLENKLTAANNLAIQKVHESLLQKIVELTQEIHSATARITTLENQWAQIRNFQKSTASSTPANSNLNQQKIHLTGKNIPPPVPNSTRPPNRRQNPVPPRSYAKAAQGDWQTVGTDKNNKRQNQSPQNTKQQKPGKLVAPKYPRSEREIVISFEHGTNEERNHATATFALDLVNKLIVDNKDVLTPPFLQTRFSLRDNLVLTTGLNHNNLD